MLKFSLSLFFSLSLSVCVSGWSGTRLYQMVSLNFWDVYLWLVYLGGFFLLFGMGALWLDDGCYWLWLYFMGLYGYMDIWICG